MHLFELTENQLNRLIVLLYMCRDKCHEVLSVIKLEFDENDMDQKTEDALLLDMIDAHVALDAWNRKIEMVDNHRMSRVIHTVIPISSSIPLRSKPRGFFDWFLGS